MSSSTGREQLNKNAGGTSSAFVDNSSGIDLFQHKNNWSKAKNYVEEEITFSSNGTTHTRGSSSVIEIDKRADLMGAMFLVFKRAAYAGTANRFSVCDWEAPYQIKEIVFSYANKVFWRQDGEKLVFDIFEGDNTIKRKHKAKQMGGDLLPRERLESAKLDQKFTVNLEVPWKKLDKMLPVMALPNKIRVEVFWRPLVEVVLCSSANLFPIATSVTATLPTAGTITDLELKCRCFHLPEQHRNGLFTQLLNQPLKIKFLAYQRHPREALTAPSSTNAIRLTNFTTDSIMIKSYIRQQENVTDGGYNNPFKTLPFVCALRDNGIFVTNYFNSNTYNNNINTSATYPDGNMLSYQSSDVLSKHYREVKQNPSVELDLVHPVTKIPLVVDEYYLHSEDNAFGSRNLSLYNALELYIDPTAQIAISGANVKAVGNEFDIIAAKQIWGPFGLHTATSSSFYVDIWSIFHNVLIIGQGDIKSWLSY